MHDNFDDKSENKYEFSQHSQDTLDLEKEYFVHSENEHLSNTNNKLKIFLSATIGILGFLVLVLIICILYFWNNKTVPFSTQNTSTKTENVQRDEANIKFESKPTDPNELSAETIYDKVAPSVVGVVVYDSAADVISDPISQGSGIVIDSKGYIVTNSHVVNNSTKNSIKIVLNNSEEVSGKVVGYDTRTDIAVIKCDRTDLTCATLGDSSQVKVGETAYALGNPLGLNFAGTFTRGIVSGVGRSKDVSEANSLVKYIQTDAAINPGNSGGPLINAYAQVIGINTLKIGAAGLEGMGFAIPSNTVNTVVSDIISKGYVSGRVRLGIGAKMISNYQAQMYNVPVGVIVSQIYRDSNFKAAGIQVGDIITKLNGVNLTSFDVFYGELYQHKPGETVTLSIFRPSASSSNGSTFDVSVVLLEDKGETQEASEEIYTD